MIDERTLANRLRDGRLLVVASGGVVVVVIFLALIGILWGTLALLVALAGVAAVGATGCVLVAVRFISWLRRRLQDLERQHEREFADRDARIAALERQLQVLSAHDRTEIQERAQRLEEAGELAEAAGALQQAVALDVADRGLRAAHRRVLRRMHATEDATKRYIAVVRAEIAAGHHEHARELAEDGHEANPKSLRLRDLLVALRDHEGQAESALELAKETADLRIRRLQRLRPAADTERHLEPSDRTFISGFFYSGSGAVLDHLRGLEGVQAWPPAGELRLVKFPGGFADLAARHADRGKLDAQALVDLYLHLTGFKLTVAPPDSYDKWGVVNRNSRRLFRIGAPTAGYLAVCLEGFVDLAEHRGDGWSTGEVEARMRSCLQRALDAAATDTDADHLVIDQAVTAWRLDIARLVPPSNFLLVHRDPRDQYTEVREVVSQPGRSTQRRGPSNFAERYRRDREAAERAIPRLERDDGHRVLQLSFEEFVLDHDAQSQRVLQHLGLEGRSTVERRFQPEVSRRNVGKHHDRLEDHEREVLNEELSEYLHPYAEGVAGMAGS